MAPGLGPAAPSQAWHVTAAHCSLPTDCRWQLTQCNLGRKKTLKGRLGHFFCLHQSYTGRTSCFTLCDTKLNDHQGNNKPKTWGQCPKQSCVEGQAGVPPPLLANHFTTLQLLSCGRKSTGGCVIQSVYRACLQPRPLPTNRESVQAEGKTNHEKGRTEQSLGYQVPDLNLVG